MTPHRRAPPFAFWSALLILAAGVAVSGWAVWPLPTQEETIPLGSLSDLLPESLPAGEPAPEFDLHLQYPRYLRLGSRSAVTAVLEPRATFTASSLPPGTNLVAVAHIRSNDVLLDPNGEIMDPLLAGSRARFTWQAAPLRLGDLESTLFIRLEIVPQEGGEVTAHTIFARAISTRGIALFRMTATTATALGVAALLTGGVLLLGAVLTRPAHREGTR